MLTSFTSDWLTIESLGQFNLVTGRNGVGKTKLMDDLRLGYFVSYSWDSRVKTEHAYLDIPYDYILEPLFSRQNILDRLSKHTLKALFVEAAEFNLHYTNMKPLWEKLLSDAHKNNIQVFATTHSMECIRAFSEVATANQYDVRLIHLHKPDTLPLMAKLSNTHELAVQVEAGLELT
jgi:AAA15 family ATPase/GTPase